MRKTNHFCCCLLLFFSGALHTMDQLPLELSLPIFEALIADASYAEIEQCATRLPLVNTWHYAFMSSKRVAKLIMTRLNQIIKTNGLEQIWNPSEKKKAAIDADMPLYLHYYYRKIRDSEFSMPIAYNRSTLLHHAARQGKLQSTRYFLRWIPIDSPKLDGRTPLHEAAHNDHAPIIDLLIKKGADINALTDLGNSPLILACHTGRTGVGAKTLLAYPSCDLTVQDPYGRTALFYAVEEMKNQEVAMLMLMRGAHFGTAPGFKEQLIMKLADRIREQEVEISRKKLKID